MTSPRPIQTPEGQYDRPVDVTKTIPMVNATSGTGRPRPTPSPYRVGGVFGQQPPSRPVSAAPPNPTGFSPAPAGSTITTTANPDGSSPWNPTGGAPMGIPSQTPTGPGRGVGLVPTDPNNPLTSQTIVPGEMADRYAIAQQKFDQFAASTAPAYQAALKQANRYGAAQGRLGSGSLRTDFGNLANQRDQQLDLSRDGFLTDALGGSIDDAWRGIGLAERQQGFQQGQQDRAWEQGGDLFGMGNTANPTAARQNAAQTLMPGSAADYWRTLGQRPAGVPAYAQGG